MDGRALRARGWAGLGTPLKRGELLVVMRFVQGFLWAGGLRGPRCVLRSEQHLVGAVGCGNGTRLLCHMENLLEGASGISARQTIKIAAILHQIN